jgi:methylated-DNA-protein-cysteine methyltransferase-like protein
MPLSPHTEAVLAAVEAIPRGSVMSYGDVAEYAGLSSARMVGRILALEAADVPWHRVVRADGTPAPHLRVRQLELLRAEGVPLRGADGDRIDMRAARWDGAPPSEPAERAGRPAGRGPESA